MKPASKVAGVPRSLALGPESASRVTRGALRQGEASVLRAAPSRVHRQTKGEKRVPRDGGVFIKTVRTMAVTLLFNSYVFVMKSSTTPDVKPVVRRPFALILRHHVTAVFL